MFRVLRDARLVDGRRVNIEIVDGLISALCPVGATTGDTLVDDLGGWLVLPALAEPHAHLDNALIAEVAPNLRGDLQGAFEAGDVALADGRITYEGTVARAIQAIELLMVHGVTAVRSHVAVGGDFGVRNVAAMLEAKSHFNGLIDIQLVALAISPMTGPEGADNRAALAAAVEAGVDLIGGCPHLDPDGPGLIETAIRVATEAGLGIDLHVDETLDPAVLTLRDLARQVQDRGFEHPVAASHCVSLGMQTPEVQAEVAKEVAEAGVSVFCLPQTNLFLQGRDHPTAMPRGLTAVRALQDAGVLVAAGADNVQDPFNPVGRSDPLETASLLVMAGHQTPDNAYRMVSNNAREGIGLPRLSIEVGSRADLMAIDAVSTRGAIADSPMSRRVYRRGVLVASSDQQTEVHRKA
ncbi:MAG: amidohydrolase family protein [Actinomycetota bacterium]|nr:amidohydrolase family protein [Actinomycetota bacterium]